MFKRIIILIIGIFMHVQVHAIEKHTINPLYFTPVKLNLEVLKQQVVKVMRGDAYVLMNYINSDQCAPTRKLCKEENIFKGLSHHIQLVDACDHADKQDLTKKSIDLIEYIARCKHEIERQEQLYRNYVRHTKNPSVDNSDDQKSTTGQSARKRLDDIKNRLGNIRNRLDGHDEEGWSIGGFFRRGLSWMMEHPIQTALGIFSLYVFYARLTGRWPFNEDQVPATGPQNQRAPQGPQQAPADPQPVPGIVAPGIQ